MYAIIVSVLHALTEVKYLMNQDQINARLLSAGIPQRCWPNVRGGDGSTYRVQRVPHDNDAMTLIRVVGIGQQTCGLRKPQAAGDAGITLTDRQWDVLVAIADSTDPDLPPAC